MLLVPEGAGGTLRAAHVGVEDGVRLAGTRRAGDGEDAGVRLAGRRVLAVVRLPWGFCKKQKFVNRQKFFFVCLKNG
jgi:hypothetical protein